MPLAPIARSLQYHQPGRAKQAIAHASISILMPEMVHAIELVVWDLKQV